MEEKLLVAKARKGDKEALELLLYNNYRIVYGYLFKLTMNKDTALDYTQEAMVKAIINICKFSGDSKFSTWLISIASNAYKDSLRKNKRIKDIELSDLDIQASDNVEERVIISEEVLRLKGALMKIPGEKRQAFILKHYYNYSYEEIAKILKCPLGTVRSRLHYCIRKLKSYMKLEG